MQISGKGESDWKRTCLLKNFVNFVDDEKFDLAEIDSAFVHKITQATGGCNDDGRGMS